MFRRRKDKEVNIGSLNDILCTGKRIVPVAPDHGGTE